jgi:hypothetical protein
VIRMIRLFRFAPLLAAIALGSVALAASPKYLCGLTGKVSSKCCCVQRGSKLLCQYTGKTLDKCCCTTK